VLGLRCEACGRYRSAVSWVPTGRAGVTQCPCGTTYDISGKGCFLVAFFFLLALVGWMSQTFFPEGTAGTVAGVVALFAGTLLILPRALTLKRKWSRLILDFAQAAAPCVDTLQSPRGPIPPQRAASTRHYSGNASRRMSFAALPSGMAEAMLPSKQSYV
jgi:hypothetical protein